MLKGSKHSDETLLKLRDGRSGRGNGYRVTDETKSKIGMANKGNPSWAKGVKFTDAHKAKISASNKGKKPPPYTEERREKQRQRMLLFVLSPEAREKIRLSKLGAGNAQWKGGISDAHNNIRKTRQYKDWRTSVYQRDAYTCVWCYKKGGALQADHIKSFAHYPELHFEISNGRTLCVSCHKKTDTYGGRSINTQRVAQ
jgi:hypothetical protein